MSGPLIEDLTRRLSDHGRYNGCQAGLESTLSLLDEIFLAAAPVRKLECANSDIVKSFWIRVPRGTADDVWDCEAMLECGDYKNRAELDESFLGLYPYAEMWFKVTLLSYEGFRAVIVFGRSPVYHDTRPGHEETNKWSAHEADELLGLLLPHVKESVGMIVDGTYNGFLDANLPLRHRTGVIARRDLEHFWEGLHDRTREFYIFRMPVREFLSDEEIEEFRRDVSGKRNAPASIGRIPAMTRRVVVETFLTGGRALPDTRMEPGLDDWSNYRKLMLFADTRQVEKLPEDDPAAFEAFLASFHDNHLWHIVQGSSRTRVTLYPIKDENGWWFRIYSLRSHPEMIRVFLALRRAGIPVHAGSPEGTLRALDSEDRLLVRPCHNWDPYPTTFNGEHFLDVVQFDSEDFANEELMERVEWFPLEHADAEKEEKK